MEHFDTGACSEDRERWPVVFAKPMAGVTGRVNFKTADYIYF